VESVSFASVCQLPRRASSTLPSTASPAIVGGTRLLGTAVFEALLAVAKTVTPTTRAAAAVTEKLVQRPIAAHAIHHRLLLITF
jgi:hypothetical protein